jgi:hypothetical protein
MTINKFWAIPLALIGGLALGTAVSLRRRGESVDAKKLQTKHELQDWEGDGGSLATQAIAKQRS